MMHRWPAALLAMVLLCLSAISAAAQGPIRSETRYAGAYTLRIDLYSDPAFTGRRLNFDVVVSASTADQLRSVTLTASAIPEAGTNASTVRATISRAGSSVAGFQGYVTPQVRGSYRLHVTISGPAGTNAVDLPLRVSAPTAIPVWFAWSIGLAPLLGLIGFGWGQRSYLARLQAGASLAPPAASTPAAT
jgi:hypothetical protein